MTYLLIGVAVVLAAPLTLAAMLFIVLVLAVDFMESAGEVQRKRRDRRVR